MWPVEGLSYGARRDTQYTNISAPFVNKYNLTCTNTVPYFFNLCIVNTPSSQGGFLVPIIVISSILMMIIVTLVITFVINILCINDHIPQLSAPVPDI